KSLPQTDDLQVRRLEPFCTEPVAQVMDDFQQQPVKLELPFPRKPDAAVEPPEFGFARGVEVVIEVENAPAEVPVLIEQFLKRRKPLPRLRRDAQDRDVRID